MTFPEELANMQRSASPSKVTPRSAPRAFTFAGHKLRMERAALGVDVAAVRRDIEQRDLRAPLAVEPPEKLGRDCRRRAVGAIGHDLQAREREAGYASDEKPNVIGKKRRMVYDRRKAARIGDLHLCGVIENLLFHGQFNRVGQLESVGAEELDAVVLPGIVRCRDDHAGVEAVRAGKKRDGRCSDDACAFHLRARPAQGLGERGGDPGAGLACVAAEQNLGLGRGLSQRVAEREPHAVDRRGVERSLARDGANAVGAEKFACGGCGHGLSSWSSWKNMPLRLQPIW